MRERDPETVEKDVDRNPMRDAETDEVIPEDPGKFFKINPVWTVIHYLFTNCTILFITDQDLMNDAERGEKIPGDPGKFLHLSSVYYLTQFPYSS